jgi:hypothetical protein
MSQNVWATIMPFGPVTNFLLAQKKFFGPIGPHFRHWFLYGFVLLSFTVILELSGGGFFN